MPPKVLLRDTDVLTPDGDFHLSARSQGEGTLVQSSACAESKGRVNPRDACSGQRLSSGSTH